MENNRVQLARAKDAKRLLGAADTALNGLINALSTGIQTPAKADIRAAPHRAPHRAHRIGNPAKIEADPELRACIIARIDTLTFDQIITQVIAVFPPNRRISRSSLHRWWQKWAGRTGGATS